MSTEKIAGWGPFWIIHENKPLKVEIEHREITPISPGKTDRLYKLFDVKNLVGEDDIFKSEEEALQKLI